MKRVLMLFSLAVSLCIGITAQSTFTFNDLMNVKRVGDPQLSPDGQWVAYTVGVVNKAENRVVTHIYRMRLNGSDQKQLTSGTSSFSSPRWSPDGKHIAFTTGGQIWAMEPDGDDKEQVTRISTGAGNPVWSPDGRWIAFSSEVYPECTSDDCNKNEDARVDAVK